MPVYSYTREWGDSLHDSLSFGKAWNIGHSGEPKKIATRIEEELPDISFHVHLYETSVDIITEEELDSSQELTLDQLIITQKTIEDFPGTLENMKICKIKEIDSRTIELIQLGFAYDGNNFSMSDAAQRNWIGLCAANNAGMLSFPFTISTVDEGAYILQDATSLLMFIGTFLTYQTSPLAPLGAGRELKAQINAATTIEEIVAIVDDR